MVLQHCLYRWARENSIEVRPRPRVVALRAAPAILPQAQAKGAAIERFLGLRGREYGPALTPSRGLGTIVLPASFRNETMGLVAAGQLV